MKQIKRSIEIASSSRKTGIFRNDRWGEILRPDEAGIQNDKVTLNDSQYLWDIDARKGFPKIVTE
ncbi:hypothetical protein ACFLVZ_02170 [Chloroflexota bacterium]